MNDLTVLTDNELEKELSLLKEREAQYESKDGLKTIQGKTLELIATIEAFGYEVKGDRQMLAKIWAHALKDQVIRIGFAGIQRAAITWYEQDSARFYDFPKVSQIIEVCEQTHGDPRVEKGRRDYERRVASIDQEHEEEVEKWKRDNPEAWERARRKAEVIKNEHC